MTPSPHLPHAYPADPYVPTLPAVSCYGDVSAARTLAVLVGPSQCVRKEGARCAAG